MKSSYIDLLDCFTLKIYSSVGRTWFMSTTQQPSIAPVDHFNLPKGMKIFKIIFKEQILEWEIKNGVTI